MTINGKRQSVKSVFSNQSNGVFSEARDASVRQDKTAQPRGRAATAQPEPREHSARPRGMSNATTRSKNHGSTKRKTVHLVLWVKPIVKQELRRVAAQEGLSMSQAAGTLLNRALAGQIDMHYNALLTPVIETAIKKAFSGYTNRLAWLLTRALFDTEQTRALVTNILGRQPGMTEERLKTILAMSQRTAKGNISRKTPETRELLEAIEKWLMTDDKKPSN